MLWQAVATAIIVIQAFLLGSIPWGVVISRLFFHDDVRTHGSGNIGTTNMIRAYGKKVGYVCFVLDFAKAAIACLIAGALTRYFVEAGWITVSFAATNLTMMAAGLSAVLGHIFSPWLGFKGGKGVACGGGVALVVFGVVPFLILLGTFAAFTAIVRAVSAGSIAAAAVFPFLGLWVFWGNVPGVIMSFAIGIIVIWSHRSNIDRLAHGTENKFGKKAAK